jgi:hypothetical protein
LSDDILVRLRLAADQFQRELDASFAGVPGQAERSGREAGDGFARGMNARAAAIGAAAASGVLAVKEAISQALDYGNEINETSRALLFNAESLQALRYAATDAGVGAEQLEDGLAELRKQIEQATGGSRDAQQSFVDMGVGFQTLEGQARSTDAVFSEVIDRLNAIEDPAERARLGSELLGDSYQRLTPILADGSAGLRQSTDDLVRMGQVLSSEDLKALEETNAQFERMKNILSVSVANVVAENSQALIDWANAAAYAAGKLLEFGASYEQYFRNNRAAQFALNPVGAVFGLAVDANSDGPTPSMQSDAARAEIDRMLGRGEFGQAQAPALSPTRRSSARRAGGQRSAAERAAAREREAAIRASQRAEEEFAETVRDTLDAQSQSVRLEEIRKEQGEAAADAEEARLGFLREHPMAVHQTVEALTAALGITRQLTAEERTHYENLIASADAAEQTAVSTARRAAEERDFQARKQEEMAQQEKIQSTLKEQADELYEHQEQSIRDLADLYEGLFTGGNGRIWKDFKQQGLGIMADIAAQWTLALLSGQSGAGGTAGKPGGNPLGMIFNSVGLLTGDPATKPGTDQAGNLAGVVQSIGSLLGMGGGGAGSAGATQLAASLAGVPGLGQALAISALTVGVGEGIEKLTGLRFDMLGGILGGGIGGFAVGALKGAVKGNATIGANGSQLGIVDSFGKRKFQDQAIGDATGIMDSLAQIADAMGVDLNSSLAAVSIGTRNGKYRVDPTGQGILKPGQGAIDFGKDQEAAVAYAIRDLIEDGVLGPISQASRNILAAGGDLQQAIEKAVLIESVPKLLKERLDPLGARLEEIDAQFRKLADALKEGGASAEQIAQARKLWQLEREDAIKQIGEASASLKEFLQSLNAGSASPLSLRQQRAEAEKALAPYVTSIEQARAAQAEVERLKANGGSASQIAAAEEAARAAAAGVDQGGFQDAAQTLLGISRQINGSSSGFFADFDRIRALTGGAIGAIDAAAGSPGAAQDPFTELTARNTGDIAAILSDHTRLLVALNDNLASTGDQSVPGRWFDQNREFSSGS